MGGEHARQYREREREQRGTQHAAKTYINDFATVVVPRLFCAFFFSSLPPVSALQSALYFSFSILHLVALPGFMDRCFCSLSPLFVHSSLSLLLFFRLTLPVPFFLSFFLVCISLIPFSSNYGFLPCPVLGARMGVFNDARLLQQPGRLRSGYFLPAMLRLPPAPACPQL